MTGPRDVITVPCPACGESVCWTAQATWRPFCSERCRMVDLGAWFTEERGFPGDDGAQGEETGRDPALIKD